MKKILSICFLSLIIAACGQLSGSDSDTASALPGSDAKVQVYYFHGKMRCVTCITLQQVAEEAIRENFEGNKDVAFIEVDFSQKENEALAEKYEVVFSSLIIANATSYNDITDQSFALVMDRPDELKALIALETNKFLTN